MKLVYVGFKQMDKFNLLIKELNFKSVKPREPFEVENHLGNVILKKYDDLMRLEDYEARFGKIKQEEAPVVEKKQEHKLKRQQRDKMQVEMQLDK